MRRWSFVLALMAVGCVGDPVGDPCTPEQAPAGGYDARETYVESGSPQCMTGVCLVRGLTGDPSPGSVTEHAYCTCRCDEGGSAPPCTCASGYHCESVGALGSYCMRD